MFAFTDELDFAVEHFLGEAVLSVKSIEVKILKVECCE
jgi:hypothetical protein